MTTLTRAPGLEPQSISEHSREPRGEPVRLERVKHSFGEVAVLEDLDLELGAGEIVGLVGVSGCGKSTLLRLVAGLLEADGGAVSVGGATTPADRLGRCAYMPQRDLLLPWLRALDNAALALRNRGLGRGEAREQARELFERFGLAEFAEARPSELSGGMRQRVAFLRTLLASKPVLLLDEPFASLDAITRADMQEWLAAALAQEPRTTLLVTHDVEEALYLCDRVVVLSPRPARVAATLVPNDPRAADRTATVTSPQFSALREQALNALRGAGS